MTIDRFKTAPIARAFVFSFAAFAFLLLAPVNRAWAVEIQTVVSDKGIKALLVEDYTVPLIALSFSFEGGSTQDEEGKEATAELLTNLLDEGAGEVKAQAFQEALDDNGMQYSFSASLDNFSGSIKALKSASEESFDLLRAMLNEPRFDEEAIDRMKASRANALRAEETNPQAIASKAYRETVFKGHPYARPSQGTLESLAAITAEDLESYRKRVFAQNNLTVGVVGAISPEELKEVLDEIFGGLPENAQLKSVPDVEVETGERVNISFDTPQTNIYMALPGIKREDPDFYAAYLANYTLGGGSFASRLYKEVREKRGLAYGAYSYLDTKDHAGVIGANTSTSAKTTQQAIDILREEFKRMAEEGPTKEEFQKAKDYVIGQYAISNLDTSGKIASVLVAIQKDGIGIDYIDKRKDYLEAVTMDDVKRVSKELFSGDPTFIVVGKDLPKDG